MDKSEQAKENFFKGYNCSQSVAAAFADDLGIDEKTLMAAAEGFGGGMGRMRLTCGAVSSMAMIAGLKLSKAVPRDIDTRTKIYETVQKMAKEFEQKNGSVICGDLLGSNIPKNSDARPEDRTAEYYKKRPCPDCVADCAAIVQKYLFDTEE